MRKSTGEDRKPNLRVVFDRRLKLEFHGSRVSSDAGRLAGYEDVNDADRLGLDPAFRWIIGGRAVADRGASTSQMGRFETGTMTEENKLAALADLSERWIDGARSIRATKPPILDMDSSVSPTFGEREGSAYNGHSVVADDAARGGGEDRREGSHARPLRDLPDGRGRRPARAVRAHP